MQSEPCHAGYFTHGCHGICRQERRVYFRKLYFATECRQDALELLPPAILTVIIASGVLVNPTTAKLDISFTNYALVAILITLLISSKVKNFCCDRKWLCGLFLTFSIHRIRRSYGGDRIGIAVIVD